MFKNIARRFRIGLVLVTMGVALVGLSASRPARASDTGVLKLKVQWCAGSSWVTYGQVDVVITRPGVGQIDSDSGTTDNSGYVEFTFDSLENGDQAHVTVTPSGHDPDDSHVYYWVHDDDHAEVSWDLGIQGDSSCQDGYYNEKLNIILCLYQ
jgi:hypothetical protein